MSNPPPPPFPLPPPLPEPPGRPHVPPLPMPPPLPNPFGTADEPRVSVRGEATIDVEPELATIALTVTARGKDRKATLAELSRRNGAALDLLKGYGENLDRLDTGSFTVAPELADRRGEKIRAYRGSVRIHATLTDFTALGELVTRLADLDHTRVHGPWWALRPDSSAHRRARQEAVHEAVRRAREYAQALGADLKALLELSDTAGEHGPPVPLHDIRLAGARSAYGARGGDETPALELEPQRQTVYAQVTAYFAMTRPDVLPGAP